MLSGISDGEFSRLSGILAYARMDPDYLDFDAIYSDDSDNFLTASGDVYTAKLRVRAGNIDGAWLKAREMDGGVISIKLTKPKAAKEADGGIFDYYTANFTPGGRTRYYFEIQKNGRKYFYNRAGVSREQNPYCDFTVVPDFNAPEWAKGAVMYQIFVDRFCNGDKTNDPVTNEYIYLGSRARFMEDWNAPVEDQDICNFYGGDLRGVIDKLDYLEDLGVECIYLNPVFISPSSHKYDAQDYDHIDPHFGICAEGGEALSFERFSNRFASMYIERTTNEAALSAGDRLFAELVDKAHKRGIKVILDGVFNHCGAFHKWMDKEGFYHNAQALGGANAKITPGAYRDEASPYKSYFRWYDSAWPNNECYDGWWGHSNHPKLYFEGSKELWADILRIAAKWVSPPYNADGWRLDVAADLGYSPDINHKFWQDFRDVVKNANPNAIILAEFYGDSTAWLNGKEWDTIMNYDGFMEPLTWFLTGMEKHSERFDATALNDGEAFVRSMRLYMSRMPAQSIYTAMNELSNHDHSRFLTRTNRREGRLHTHGAASAEEGVNHAVMREAIAAQMTWPGAPTLYYGDEAGVAGWTDPDNRRTFPWGKEDKTMTGFYRKMIEYHKLNEVLRFGAVEFLLWDKGLVCFGRFFGGKRAGARAVITALNNLETERTIEIPVWRVGGSLSGKLSPVVISGANGYKDEFTAGDDIPVVNGFASVVLPSIGAVVLEIVNG